MESGLDYQPKNAQMVPTDSNLTFLETLTHMTPKELN